jgi:hypothetical protein
LIGTELAYVEVLLFLDHADLRRDATARICQMKVTTVFRWSWVDVNNLQMKDERHRLGSVHGHVLSKTEEFERNIYQAMNAASRN